MLQLGVKAVVLATARAYRARDPLLRGSFHLLGGTKIRHHNALAGPVLVRPPDDLKAIAIAGAVEAADPPDAPAIAIVGRVVAEEVDGHQKLRVGGGVLPHEDFHL